jgi:lysophospholipase L1-like esterase
MTRSTPAHLGYQAAICLASALLVGALTIGCTTPEAQPGDDASTGSGGSGGGGVAGEGGSPGSGGSPAGSGGSPGSGGVAGTGGRIGGSGGTPGTGGAVAGTGGRIGTGGATGTGGRVGTLRIMPLGDSTTGSVCWRPMLWQKLNQGGFTGRFDFVGSRHNDPGCNVAGYDQDNEGHPGVLVTNFINDADDTVAGVQTPQALLGQNPADVVLFHFATNDVWNNIAPQTILDAYSKVVDALRAANPKVVILAAQLIPMNPVNTATCTSCLCTACGARMQTFNAAIPAWAQGKSTTTSPIVVVDQWTGFDANADTVDGVHPNASGSAKIAAKWYTALMGYF